MHADDRVDLTAVFGPEHGFRGTAQAGGAEGRHDDPATGLPVYDTYLKSGQALADVFAASGVDTVVFDVQDVGARFYTYIWTLFDCMEAAALAGRRFVVLDRPNPVTGRAALARCCTRSSRRSSGGSRSPRRTDDGGGAGPAVQRGVPDDAGAAGDRDHVGLEAVGLLRRLRAAVGAAEPEHADAGDGAGVLGTCLFEGTNLSEGRGTTRPFELLGAEGIDGRWADGANALGLEGVRFREAYFTPTFSKFQGRTVGASRCTCTTGRRSIRADGDRTADHRQAVVERFRLACGRLDRQAHRLHARTHHDRRGRGHGRGGGRWQEELAGFRRTRRGYLLYR
ncbi:hypothetical protein GCM10023238_09720 [Streptomyces heliomycini]